MPNQLNINCGLNTTSVPADSSPRLVYLLVEVGEGASAVPAGPAPVNLGLVVDVSESMFFRLVSESEMAELAQQGMLEEVMVDGVPAWRLSNLPSEVLARLPRKIDRLQEALRVLVAQLHPVDSFALIAFAGHATTLIPTTSGQDKSRLLAEIDRLKELRLGDDTYMGRGMELGLAEMQHRNERGQVKRLLLLTDGFTKDETECRTHAVAAQATGVSISTMGLGGEFNEELLIPMADQSGGHAYLVDDITALPAMFAQEFSAAQAVAYHNLELKLHLMAGAELRRAFRVKPVISDLGYLSKLGDSYNVPLGDLERDAPPALLLEVVAPPRQPGVFRLAQLVLAYEPVGLIRSDLDASEKVRQEVVVQYMPGAVSAPLNPRVMNLVETVSAFKLQTRALQEAEAGDVAGATRKLQAAATRLLDMGQDELAAAVQSQAQQLAQQGQLDPHATKKLRYETRKLTQKLE